MRSVLVLAVAAFLCSLPQSNLSAAVDWPTLTFAQPFTNTFTKPTCITHAGDGSQRLFIVEQSGRISIVQSNSVLPQPFLDITNRVLTTGAEQGLLGLAFPTNFSSNGHFYVHYTRKPDGAVTISRFQLSPDANVADTNSEQVIKVITKSFNNHNGGQLAFGPDGYLYIGVGDGGSENDPQLNGQKTTNLLGKVLRIDVESGASPYAIPTSNPFVTVSNYAPEIWALGLRNPWRFSFDRQTGDLYIADVGQNRFEEIDFQPAGSTGGQNYGWRIVEGPTNYMVPAGFTNFAAFTAPVAWYDHFALPADGGGSVTGGYVYRGPTEPRLDGVYLYGDFITGWMWGLKQDAGVWQSAPLVSSSSLSPSHFFISTFGEDEQGQLYLADYMRGKIYQIQDSHQVCTPTFTPASGIINFDTVTVNCLTTNAEIHYTTNGIDPTLTDPFVSSGQSIPALTGLTNKARAFRADLTPSDVTRATFVNNTGAPLFSPTPGAVTNGTSISISTVTPGATIYFQTNGTPTTNSPVYSGPITFTGNVNLRALAVRPGFNNSATVFGNYSLIQVAPPVFSPTSGPITNGSSLAVSLSCTTTGAVIYYTLDGTLPDTNSASYTSPLSLTTPTTVSARAFNTGWAPSSVQSNFFSLLDQEKTVVTTWAGGPIAGFSNAVGALASFSNPLAICTDQSNGLYVADANNFVVRRISPARAVSTYAGTGVPGSQDGPATNAQFQAPTSVCIDSGGNVFVLGGDCNTWGIRKIDTNHLVTTVASFSPGCRTITQIEVDAADNTYVGYDNRIWKIAADGNLTDFAGDPTWRIGVGIGIDAATNLYAANEYKIWKITPDGSLQIFAGGNGGYSDGPRLSARFDQAQDTFVDAHGNIFVTEPARLRKIYADGRVTTLAGTGVSGYKNGRGFESQFNSAAGLCTDTNGNVYVADSANNCIRKISPDTANIGIADDWQLEHFQAIGIDPKADPDHDGLNNYAEFWAGTDPLNASSALAIDVASLAVGGQIQIRWQTVPGKSYMVQYSSDLVSWNNLGSLVQGDGFLASVIDPAPPAVRRYYRIWLAAF